jgi:hypothetical protein
MPEDLQEIVGDGRGKYFWYRILGLYWAIYNISNIFTVWGMVGSNRTILAICGFDEIIQMIDDPAYNLEDELESTPIGAHPAEFLLARYSEESKVPVVAQMKYLDGSFRELQTPRSRTVLELQIPSVVASTPTTFDIAGCSPIRPVEPSPMPPPISYGRPSKECQEC